MNNQLTKPIGALRVLHSSDWHLGRVLYGKQRDREHQCFLDWLLEQVTEQQVDLLLVAGDIFDNSTPSHRAQQLYYRFLHKLSLTSCRHLVIIAGNHDSPTLLDAPKALLKAFNVHVVGAVTDNPEDEVLSLYNRDQQLEAVVCAVPYLRDRDIRLQEAGETLEDKAKKLQQGIKAHYQQVCELAQVQRDKAENPVPMIVMGHLFVAGGETQEDDGVRELYVGSLAHLSAAIFPDCADYVALGHLHLPQQVAGNPMIRYSGTPIPIGFGEAKQQKSLAIIDFVGRESSLSLLNIPNFQAMVAVKGDWPAIEGKLTPLLASEQSIWVEVIYEGTMLSPELRQQLEMLVADSKLELLRVRHLGVIQRALGGLESDATLEDLSIEQVFQRCLDIHQVEEDKQPLLKALFAKVQHSLDERDQQA